MSEGIPLPDTTTGHVVLSEHSVLRRELEAKPSGLNLLVAALDVRAQHTSPDPRIRQSVVVTNNQQRLQQLPTSSTSNRVQDVHEDIPSPELSMSDSTPSDRDFLNGENNSSLSPNEYNSSADKLSKNARRQSIPDTLKDEAYWEKRRRNNEAAKRSREKRRMNDMAIEAKLMELSQENNVLKKELTTVAKCPKLDPIAPAATLPPTIPRPSLPLLNPDITPNFPQPPISALPHIADTRSFTSPQHIPSISQNSSFPVPYSLPSASTVPNNPTVDAFGAPSPFSPYTGLLPPSAALFQHLSAFAAYNQAAAAIAAHNGGLLTATLPPQLSSIASQPPFASLLQAPLPPSKQASPDSTVDRILRPQPTLPTPLTSVLQLPPTSVIQPRGHVPTVDKDFDSTPPTSGDTNDGDKQMEGKQYLRYKLLERNKRLEESREIGSNLFFGNTSLPIPPTPSVLTHGGKGILGSLLNPQLDSKPINNLSINTVPSSETVINPLKRPLQPEPLPMSFQVKREPASSVPPPTSAPLGDLSLKQCLSSLSVHMERVSAFTESMTSGASGTHSESGTSDGGPMSPSSSHGGSQTSGLSQNSPSDQVQNMLGGGHHSNPHRRELSESQEGHDEGGGNDGERYLERRRRNNEAAKRCRANRRALFEYRFKRAQQLEQENTDLKDEMQKLTRELTELKELFAKKNGLGNVSQLAVVLGLVGKKNAAEGMMNFEGKPPPSSESGVSVGDNDTASTPPSSLTNHDSGNEGDSGTNSPLSLVVDEEKA